MIATDGSTGPVQGPSNGWRLLIFKKTVTGSVYSCGCFGVMHKVISNSKAMITGTYHGKEKIHTAFFLSAELHFHFLQQQCLQTVICFQIQKLSQVRFIGENSKPIKPVPKTNTDIAMLRSILNTSGHCSVIPDYSPPFYGHFIKCLHRN